MDSGVTLGSEGRPVVLYFYPKDDTPGCTRQACAFRDARARYEAAGARVIGVSPDDPASHAKFAEKYALPFTLVADPEKTVCERYGVWKEKNLYGKKSMGVVRATFVIDREGVVRRVFPRVKVDGHSEAVLDALEAALLGSEHGQAVKPTGGIGWFDSLRHPVPGRARERRGRRQLKASCVDRGRGRGRRGSWPGAARACGGPCTFRR